MRRYRKEAFPGFDLQRFGGGSGAGLNYSSKILLRAPAGSGGPYDSAVLYGPLMWEAAYFSKTSFQILAQSGTTNPLSGWSVACYGTHDVRALLMNQSPLPKEIPPGFTLPDTSWCEVALPQTETSPSWANPITSFGVTAFSPEPWIAVRVVATATDAVGDIAITCTRIP